MTASPSTDHLLRVIQSARIGVWTWDFSRQKFDWSPLCLEMFGVEPHVEVSYRLWLDRVHPDDRADVQRAVQVAIAGRTEFNCDYRVIWPDGSVHWLTSFAQPVFASNGVVTSLEGFLRDITSRKQAEVLASERTDELSVLQLRLAQRAVDAETADRAKHAFLCNVSHELRTPLNHILGGVDVLREESHTAAQGPWLDIISQSGRHLLGMIEQIIAATASEAGSPVVDPCRFSLRALLRDAVAPLSNQAARKHVRFDLRLDRALPDAVIGDPTLIADALRNYLDNALRFAPSDSVIAVSASSEASVEGGLQVRLEVHDHGPGVAEEVLKVLFSEFDCDDTAVHRMHGGLGMGLARTRKLALLMGGQVGFESRPGHGARFWLTLPLQKVDPGSSSRT